MSRIDLKGINKYYGKTHILKDLNLSIQEGEFMTLLGPSGCGKTTTLRVIAGLEQPQSGTLHIGGEEMVNVSDALYKPAAVRNLNLVFQSYALWPHMTVFNNVAFGLETAKVPKAQVKTRVENALTRMQIIDYKDRFPSELSGGQQQRVAIARAIVTEPKILLLDEPLSNLDAGLRVEMRTEIKRLHNELGTTIIYVTHDQTEALTMSTRIAAFFNGVLTQVDTPARLYKNPCNLQVAKFIGNPYINFIEATGKIENNTLTVQSALGEMAFREHFTDAFPKEDKTFDCVLALRPEQITLQEEGGTCRGTITTCMPAGSETLVYITVDNTPLLIKTLGLIEYAHNQGVSLAFNPNHVNVYDAQTGELIKMAV